MIKKLLFIIIISILILSIFGSGKEKRIDITSITITFDKTDAIFTVNYDLGDFPRIYILILGSKVLEPEINSIFSNFNYKIKKMDEYNAVLLVKNFSRFEKGYYLYDSNTKFGQGIDEIDIYLPGSSEPKRYSNLFLFNWDNVPGADNYNLINFLKNDIGIKWEGDLKLFKELNNKSIIGIKENKNKEKLFEIDLDKNKRKSALIFNNNINNIYDLNVVENNGRYYIYSPYIYSIPNLFYKD